MDREHFLQEETRCDYLVDARMKRVWKVQMDLLELYLDLCKKHNLKCFALGGTLLGAVRHGGYIPWDDDIDMGMLREDYDKFVRIAPSELTAPFFLQNVLSDNGCFRLFNRIRNSDTTGIIDRWHHFPCNNGMYLDIFPVDSYGKNPKYYLMHKYSTLLQRTADQYLRYDPKKPHSLAGRILYPISRLIDYKKAYARHQKMCTRISRKKTKLIGQTNTSTLTRANRHMIWRREDFERIVLLDYEYLKIPAPAGYDRMLRTMYGDYMAFPPVEERGTYHRIQFDVDTPYKQYCAEHYGVHYDD